MDEIRIVKTPNRGTFEVFQGDKRTDELSADETIGIVTTILVVNSTKNSLNWLMTNEEHLRQRANSLNWSKHIPQREPMLQLPPYIDYGQEALDRFVMTLEHLED